MPCESNAFKRMTMPPSSSSSALSDTVGVLLGHHANRLEIAVLAECDSTNTVLMARAENGAPSGTVLITAHQTAGRGRRGRRWISAPGDSLTFSLLWRFPVPTNPAGLSLAVGLAIARAITKIHNTPANPPASRRPVHLKWPNDILLDGKKLGGILVELVPGTFPSTSLSTSVTASAPSAAVIGIGINLRLPEAMPPDIRASATALAVDDATHLLAAALIELLAVLDQFEQNGFVSMRDDWSALHAHQNAPVCLLSDFAPPREGLCRGVDVDGALLLEVNGRIERVLSGEISLRGAA
jgi:BirA family biotin operon repressor/biotin-[acetyl-CoA-carboxylase] ligase